MSLIPRALRTARTALVASMLVVGPLVVGPLVVGPLGAAPARAQAEALPRAEALAQTDVSVPGLVEAALPAAAPAEAGRSDLIGQLSIHVTKYEDTLIGLAVELGIGYTELLLANPGVDPWLPGEGISLLLPTRHVLPLAERRGIVVNLGDQRLYYFAEDGRPAASFPIGIGREGWATPLGGTQVVHKRKDPVWIPPPSIRAEKPELPASIGPGPDNPLGPFALNLGFRHIVIHGNANPDGVGRRVSHGCMRMYNRDIGWLFAQVPVGTPVRIVNQPVKAGWADGELFLEVHPTIEEADLLDQTGKLPEGPVADLVTRIADVAGDSVSRIDWEQVKKVAADRQGIPVQITRARETPRAISRQNES